MGLLPPSLAAAKEFCKVLTQTHPNGSFENSLQILNQEADSNQAPAPAAIPSSSVLAKALHGLIEANEEEVNLVSACGEFADAPAGWSAIVAHGHQHASVSSSGYVQVQNTACHALLIWRRLP